MSECFNSAAHIENCHSLHFYINFQGSLFIQVSEVTTICNPHVNFNTSEMDKQHSTTA